MGMKPTKSGKRALFEEVGVETPQQMPVRPKGGMIDARPKGARGAVRLWMAALILLAVLMLGLEGAALRAALPEPLDMALPFGGAALAGVWALGALLLALARKLPPGWGGRSLGLGALCALVLFADPAVFTLSSKALRGDVETSSTAAAPPLAVLPEVGGMPPLTLLPATPPVAAPVAEPVATAPERQDPEPQDIAARLADGTDVLAAQITRMRDLAGAPLVDALRRGVLFALLGFAFWYALLLGRTEAALIAARRQADARLFGLSTGLMHATYVQLLLGALVTTLGAGAVFGDWPLMGGAFVPPEALSLEPIWRNFTENQGLVQFLHRMAGYLVLGLGLVVLLRARRSVHAATRTAFLLVGLWLVVEVVIGVTTLLRADPMALHLTHLGVAVVLWGLVLRARFLTRYPRVQSIRRSA